MNIVKLAESLPNQGLLVLGGLLILLLTEQGGMIGHALDSF